jgi:hypothetical protein
MVNTLFATREDFLRHVVTPLPLSRARSADLFQAFQESGHTARQENIGITIMPKLMGTNVYIALAEGAVDAYGQVQVVMLSHPSFSDDEYDSWVDVVREWSAAISLESRVAYSRKIRLLKKVEDGIPLNVLHRDMPASLLFTYRRPGDFVMVVDPPLKNKRKIYTTKNIG